MEKLRSLRDDIHVFYERTETWQFHDLLQDLHDTSILTPAVL